jgi:hypothetical protein
MDYLIKVAAAELELQVQLLVQAFITAAVAAVAVLVEDICLAWAEMAVVVMVE